MQDVLLFKCHITFKEDGQEDYMLASPETIFTDLLSQMMDKGTEEQRDKLISLLTEAHEAVEELMEYLPELNKGDEENVVPET